MKNIYGPQRVFVLEILLILFLAVFSVSNTDAATVKVKKSKDGWRLLVNGKPFFIKGVVFEPDKIGESAHESTLRDWAVIDDDNDGREDIAFQSWVDKNKNNIKDPGEKEVGDFRLLKDMGCNTIRIYHSPSGDPEIMKINPTDLLHNHAPNKKLYRKLYKKYRIWIMMGNLLGAYTIGSGAQWEKGTDYRDPVQRENMTKSVDAMVKEFKDEPYILMWALGNENDFVQFTKNNSKEFPEVYARFVNDITKRIHKLDPKHPVALINGDVNFLRKYKELIPDIDIMGYNTYRYPTFGDLWLLNGKVYDKPVLISEFGTGYPPLKEIDGVMHMNESRQATMHKVSWLDIENHAVGKAPPGNSIGGFVFDWMDDWWQDGNPTKHDIMPSGWHHEWNGLISQGNGQNSPLVRQPRQVYFLYKDLWAR